MVDDRDRAIKYYAVLTSQAINPRIVRSKVQADENHQGNTIKTSSDPLHIHGGPITRARAKTMQAALNGIIEKIWIENAIQDARQHELGLKRRQGIVGIIQVQMQKGQIRNKNCID